jgi:hypothetical protein
VGAFDFQKLGLDRLSQNIKRSVVSPQGVLTTGDITKGAVVEVEVRSDTTGTSQVADRRTGAVLLGHDCTDHRFEWTITGTDLIVTLTGSGEYNFTFWVF